MEPDDQTPRAVSLIQKMKETLQGQKRVQPAQNAPELNIITCPNCGAGRAKTDGLTHCAYCNFEFIKSTITDGIHLKKSDNSAR